jgi:CHAT domain-containing protein
MMAHTTLGLIQMSLGEKEDAQKSEQTALDLAESTNNRADQAAILKNLGLISIQKGNFEEAYHLFKRATTIDSSLGLSSGLAYDYRNIGNLLNSMHNPTEGLRSLENGLWISQSLGDRRNIIQCYYALSQSYSQKGDRKTALAMIDSGLTMAEGLILPEIVWRIYRQRALILSATGMKTEALQDFRKAVDMVENLRAQLKVEEFQQGFLDDKMDLYVDVVRHLLDMGKVDDAFDFVERAKSRNFIDLLGNQSLVLPKAHGVLLDKEKQARLAVQEAQSRLATFTGNLTQPKTEEKRMWEETLSDRRKTYQDVLVSIQAENPELASFVSVNPLNVSEIQKILTDSTALVEYFLTPDAIYLWLIDSENITSKKVEIREEQIDLTVKQFREAIQANLSSDREGKELYQWLILPVEKELRRVRHLVLVPHNILHYLPFSALQDGQDRYIIERFSISTIPSATVLGYCVKKGNQKKKRDIDKQVLALSNPDLGDPRFDLAFAEKEVQSLKRSFRHVISFFGKEANKDAARDHVEGQDVIHFACHATYEPDAPLFSALLLSPRGSDNGRLEARDIFGLNLNCDLVMLSACESGLGKITRGDEVIGLSRSFIFAGTPSIITSLWKVDDLATAVLVKRFYRYLQAGCTSAEALRRAQILVKEVVSSQPAAWAAFGLTGDFR